MPERQINLKDARSRVSSRQDLAEFVGLLCRDLEANEAEWENPTLGRYLFALQAVVEEIEGAYKNRGQKLPDQPSWALVAELLSSAKYHE